MANEHSSTPICTMWVSPDLAVLGQILCINAKMPTTNILINSIRGLFSFNLANTTGELADG